MNVASKNQFEFYASTIRRHLFTVAEKISLEAILIFWFAVTPLAAFYVRFPFEQSLITFDRLIFFLALLTLALKFYRHKTFSDFNPHDNPALTKKAVERTPDAGHRTLGTSDTRLQTFFITKFELVWLLLSVIALASALLDANNVGYAFKIAFDAFFLPLIAFHLARYHFDVGGRERAILAAAILLAFLLFFTGLFEFATGQNLFVYPGSEILRERELRINGLFASDSSFAIICLLLALFLRIAPALLEIKFDKTARLLYWTALAAIILATLLPFFRATMVALIICLLAIEILLHLKRASGYQQNRSVAFSPLTYLRSHRTMAYALIAVVVLALGAAFIEMQSESSIVRRLTSPRNLYGRMATWQTAARIALEKPLFGVGLANYADYFDTKFSDLKQQEDWVENVKAINAPHSNFILIMAELGFFAFALYLLAYFYLISMGIRAFKRAQSRVQILAGGCFLLLLVAYTLPGMTLSSGVYADLNLYFFFLLGLTSQDFGEPVAPSVSASQPGE
ncbi:MAG: O-antigen ligase family protein [Acidobacteriota bacterium]